MAVLKGEDIEKRSIEIVACLMAAAARTAPKTRGLDCVKVLLVTGEDIERLAKAMEDKSREKKPELKFFARDAGNIRDSSAVLLIGVSGNPKKIEEPFNCGACGYKSCGDFLKAGRREGADFTGPICIFQALDLGIALGSAVKIASELNVDNRIMYSVGAAAKRLKLLESDVIMGIPLSVKGKNPFFDRK